MHINNTSAVVLDIGSRWIKAGFAGEDAPASVLPSIGTENEHQVTDAINPVLESTQTLCPIEKGIVTSWGDMEALLRKTFTVGLEQTDVMHNPILLTGTPCTFQANNNGFAELIFEQFAAPALKMALPQVLTLLAHGQDTGVAIDMGHQFSTIMPIHKGRVVGSGINRRLAFSGHTCTQYLLYLLKRTYLPDTPSDSFDIVQDIKHKLCYTAANYDVDFDVVNKETVQYKFPQGSCLSFKGGYIVKAAEPMFRPGMLGVGIKGIQRCIVDTIDTCDDNIQEELYSNIYLAGGSSHMKGLTRRLKRELEQITPIDFQINLALSEFGKTKGEERIETSAWVGGSKLASSPDFREKWISKNDYEEFGSQIIDRNS